MVRTQLFALATLMLLAASIFTASGARQLHTASAATSPAGMMAGAPGPAMGKPLADILFTVSAKGAQHTANTLTLSGVAPVALHMSSGQGIGATPIGEFANSSAGGLFVSSMGQWLEDPDAVLVGTGSNGTEKALVKLSSPKLSSDGTTLTFKATILPADSEASLSTDGGVTARLVSDRANGLASNSATAASSAPLTDAALFIDMNSQALAPQARTECLFFCFGGWGHGHGGWHDDYGYGGGGWHDGWGGHHDGWGGHHHWGGW